VVDPGNIGTAFRGFQPDGPAAALDALADARLREARTGVPAREKWLPDTLQEAAAAGMNDVDLRQAITYYLTGRGGNEHATNRRLSRGDSLLFRFEASAERLWDLAPSPADRFVVAGARHYEMYDVPEYVDAAVDRLATFYEKNL
jgi:fermentation-respiration switch protein FrsA (DUF1100 family)